MATVVEGDSKAPFLIVIIPRCKGRCYSIYIYDDDDDVWLARISLTLSLHVSLSFIAFGRSSGLHPISSHSCCMNVRAGRPAFDWPYAGVHRSTSLTISSLLLQRCPAYIQNVMNEYLSNIYTALLINK